MKEEQLIELIGRRIKPKSPDVIAGPGDDAAVLSWDSKNYMLLTTDCLVEGTHFRLDGMTSFYAIGKRAMAVNLSDIAAMGGTPLYALVSAGLPEGSGKAVSELLRGMQKMSDLYGFDIVGGNLSRSPFLFIDISLTGMVEKKYLRMRSGGKPGNGIFVTGRLGGAAEKNYGDIKPRINESRAIIKAADVTAMMDISDGLSSDVIKLATASRSGCMLFLDKIPVAYTLLRRPGITPEAALERAMNDGEDYELLFTVNTENGKNMPFSICSTPVTKIGELTTNGRCLAVTSTGTVSEIKPSGYSHF